jgi:hypothetical protein
MDVDRLAVHNRSTNNPSAIRDGGQSTPNGNLSKVSDAASDLAVYAPHYSVGSVTELRRALGDHIEHRLKICRRAGDHPKNVAGRRFPFE